MGSLLCASTIFFFFLIVLLLLFLVKIRVEVYVDKRQNIKERSIIDIA